MKDRKKLAAALVAITGALKKGYALLNEEGHLSEVSDRELPRLCVAITGSLTKEISLIDDNEQYEGMSPEEIEADKAASKASAIARLQEESAAEFQKLLDSKKPVVIEEIEEIADESSEPLPDQDENEPE